MSEEDQAAPAAAARRPLTIVWRIGPTPHLANFQRALLKHVADMRLALEGATPMAAERINARRPAGTVVTLAVKADASQVHSSAQRFCNRCFQDLMREFGRYVDWLMAVKNAARAPREMPSDAKSGITFTWNWLRAERSAIARRRGLPLARKLDAVGPVTDDVKRAIGELAAVRNCLEHHDGIALRELRLPYIECELAIGGGAKVEQLPFDMEEGQELQLSMHERVRVLPAEQSVWISEAEVEGVAMFLYQVAGPQLHAAWFQSPSSDHAARR